MKTPEKYICEVCDYNTYNKKDMKKHTNTIKHQKRANSTIEKQNTCMSCNIPFQNPITIDPNSSSYHCNHKQIPNNEIIDQDIRSMLIDLMKQNQELQQQVINMAKENRTQIHTGDITNKINHHKNFNINFFLNETCKNAMNLSEFVDSIQIDLMDFEMTGKKGYVEGITQIIKKSLKKLDIVERPMHCTDGKREIIYVKDDDKWEKETNEKSSKLSRAINNIANKNLRLAVDWQHKYPDCQVNNTAANHELVSMMPSIFGGNSMMQMEKNRSKIVSNITKEIMVSKSRTLE